MNYLIDAHIGSNPLNKEAKNDFISYVDELISKGNKRFLDLSKHEQQTIAAKLLNALQDPFEWLVEGNGVNKTIQALINSFLYCGTQHAKIDLADALQDHFLSYYREHLINYFKEIVYELDSEERKEYYRRNPHLNDPEWLNSTNTRR